MYKKAHFWTGIIFLFIFILSGMYMKCNLSDIADNQLMRMMYRSNHIYLLMTALVNLILGFYIYEKQNGLRLINKIGSGLTILSPFVLLIAFFYEPPQLTLERFFTFLGIVFLLTGVLLIIYADWLEKKKSN